MSSIYNNTDVNIAYNDSIDIVQSEHNIHFPLVSEMSRKKSMTSLHGLHLASCCPFQLREALCCT